MYRADVQVKSVAMAWRSEGEIITRFSDSPATIRADLEHLARAQAPLLVHNVGFEGLVFLCKFPDLKFNVHADTMRLVQVYANDDSVMSYGLKPAAERILGLKGWDDEINTWLANQRLSKNDLGRAPRQILRAYNCGDVVATLRLFEHITEAFRSINYNWAFDHSLYLSSAQMIIGAKARGLAVDRARLAAYAAQIEAELTANEAEFRAAAGTTLDEAERMLTAKEQSKFKKKIVAPQRFNVDSNAHRELLFCELMDIAPKYQTKGGSPSFKAEHLGGYGPLGKLLEDRKSRQIVLTQAESLLALSGHDERWHLDLKMAGTSTGRYAGGSQ